MKICTIYSEHMIYFTIQFYNNETVLRELEHDCVLFKIILLISWRIFIYSPWLKFWDLPTFHFKTNCQLFWLRLFKNDLIPWWYSGVSSFLGPIVQRPYVTWIAFHQNWYFYENGLFCDTFIILALLSVAFIDGNSLTD